MSQADWIIFSLTILVIVIYGVWRSRGAKTMDDYFLADKKMPWYMVALSVMATQASAITYLSAPGQGYTDGMRFVQFYFGLPLAMIIISVFFLPIFKKWNVFTAYEYLEDRFDSKTRFLTAGLFLLQRGISTGITIYAPAIILSSILGVNIYIVIIITGLLVIGYTMMGGAKAVAYTQTVQMGIIFSSLFLVFFLLIKNMPQGVSLHQSLLLAGKMGKINAIDFEFDLSNRYNVWSGIIGGLFLQLSYFGTDQSQVGRYLTGKSLEQSKMGLMMNGFIKIPMQFFILLLGVLVFAFYQFKAPPMYFDTNKELEVLASTSGDKYRELQLSYDSVFNLKQEPINILLNTDSRLDPVKFETAGQRLSSLEQQAKKVKQSAKELIQEQSGKDEDDVNYIFLYYITHQLPIGVIGLLMAVILLAAMGATSGGLSALTSTTVIDFIKRFSAKSNQNLHQSQDLRSSKLTTIVWGLFCILVALFAGRVGNLIEAVNILGSLFYGVILGIFLTAFMFKRANGNDVFIGALVAEVFVVITWYSDIAAFLWLNLIGCALVLFIAWISFSFRQISGKRA